MPLITLATSNKASWESFRQRVSEKKHKLESARQMKITRIRHDVERVSKREFEYAKSLIEELVPVKITWNEEAINKFQDLAPFKVEFVEKNKEEVDVVEADQ